MKKYINTRLRDNPQMLYEIAALDDDIEIELDDDILMTYHQDNPFKVEVRIGIDGDTVVSYDIADGLERLLADYGNLFIENIR